MADCDKKVTSAILTNLNRGGRISVSETLGEILGRSFIAIKLDLADHLAPSGALRDLELRGAVVAAVHHPGWREILCIQRAQDGGKRDTKPEMTANAIHREEHLMLYARAVSKIAKSPSGIHGRGVSSASRSPSAYCIPSK